ncbi:MAG: methyltransferase domain-containing protein [Chloroflexota bacterium]
MKPNFFDAGSPFLNHPLLTSERTQMEVDFVLAQLALPAGSAILDVGCGFGRHAIELARRGFQITAVDPASAMIERGRADAQKAGVEVDFKQVAGEQLVFENQFDAAIALFTTIGQLSAQAGNSSQALKPIYAALKPGGQLIVEVPQMDTAVKNLKPFDQFGSEAQGTRIEREFDAQTQIVTEKFELYGVGKSRHFLLQYRLFSQDGLIQLMQQAGFEIEARFGSYDQTPLEESSPIMILLGKK